MSLILLSQNMLSFCSGSIGFSHFLLVMLPSAIAVHVPGDIRGWVPESHTCEDSVCTNHHSVKEGVTTLGNVSSICVDS